jgi:hypothetical protein
MLGGSRGIVLESKQGTFDVAGHGHVARAGIIIPLEGQTAVPGTGPINTYFVRLSECGQEMVGVGAVGVANAKIVHHETEHDVSRVMPPKAVREWERCVPVGLEEGNELVVGDASGLWQTVHATADFDIDVSIVD